MLIHIQIKILKSADLKFSTKNLTLKYNKNH